MPASLGTEELLLELILKKQKWTETKSYLGLSTIAAPEKKTTEKVFGEAEIKEAKGWVRKEIDTQEWVVVKSEGTEGFTVFKNKNAITLVSAIKEITEEKKLESFCIKKEATQAADKAETKTLFLFGKLTIPITLNEATSKAEIPVEELVIECQ